MYVSRVPSGKWKATYRDAAGQRHSRSFERKRDADGWAADREAEVRRGRHVDPRQSRQPVAVLVERWWSGRVVEATTAATDRGRLDNHVLPHWGSWPVEAVTRSGVQAWIKKLSASGLAPATVRSCHHLMSSLLQAAVLDGLLSDNPARGARVPAAPPGRKVFLSRDEVDAVAAAMTRPSCEHFDRAVLWGLVLTGARWGEVAGLSVPQLDMLRGRIDVSRTLTEIDGKFRIKHYPKSGRTRVVPMTRELVDLLAEHLARYPAQTDDLGTLVFRPRVLGYHRGRGVALSRHAWPRLAFRPAVRAALSRDDVTIHDLRHCTASWMAQDGVPLVEVARVLGHTNASVTERYSHLEPDNFERVLSALSQHGTAGIRSASVVGHPRWARKVPHTEGAGRRDQCEGSGSDPSRVGCAQEHDLGGGP